METKKYILVRKEKSYDNKKFYQYALRDKANEELWLSANVTKEVDAKFTIEKPVFPVEIELSLENYFIGSYKITNKVTGEVTNVPKVVIKDYVSATHIELPQKTIEDVFAKRK